MEKLGFKLSHLASFETQSRHDDEYFLDYAEVTNIFFDIFAKSMYIRVEDAQALRERTITPYDVARPVFQVSLPLRISETVGQLQIETLFVPMFHVLSDPKTDGIDFEHFITVTHTPSGKGVRAYITSQQTFLQDLIEQCLDPIAPVGHDGKNTPYREAIQRCANRQRQILTNEFSGRVRDALEALQLNRFSFSGSHYSTRLPK